MDIAKVRGRFSSLQRGFVFLDAPGGTQVPDEVGRAVAQNYEEASGNIGFPYETSRRAAAVVDDARAAAARFLGCSTEEVVFGPNMTSLNFMLTRTFGRTLRAGDEIVTTRLDHDGNVAPWLEIARDLDLVVREVDIHPDTTLDYDDLARLLTERTKIVSFPWASNAVGTTVDAARVCALAHDAGAVAWIDAVQYAPHEPIDVRAVGADVLLCSSYKFCGPHLGIAYGRQDLLESWRPYKARPAGLQPVGHRFETGTLPYELLAALVATFSYLDSLGGIKEIAAWERQLGERLLAGLPSDARLYGARSMDGRVPTFLVNFAGVPSGDLSVAFAERGFGVWSGDNYYALGLYDRLNWGDALRVGLSHYNTLEEIDRFNEVLAELVANYRSAHEASCGVDNLLTIIPPKSRPTRAEREQGGVHR
jgi:cysteine desulfurase family protein (TIGR01976 family)